MLRCRLFRTAEGAEPNERTGLVRRAAACLFLLCAVANAPAALGAPAPDTLAICPVEMRAALLPWLEHRRRQGHGVTVVGPAVTVEGVHHQIRQAAKPGPLRFIVLIGDVPIPLVSARVNVHWGSEPEIATDAPYADLDDDGVPDVAIGRLPVRTPQELANVVAKILRYEKAAGHDLWRRRVNIVAGLGGFGLAADTAMEVTTRALVDAGIPAGYQTHLTYASWQSPYCPPPAQFRDCMIGEVNSGCLFWVYLGHGQRTLLDDVYVPGGRFPILSKADVPRLGPHRASAGSPIALLVACYSGAFDAPETCLGEAMLTSADGPVAVIAASRVTLPYGNAVLCSELMDECFTQRRSTVGEVLLHAKRESTAERPDDKRRRALDFLARLLSPVPATLEAERREHADLYNLLGDPLLSIARGRHVPLDVPQSASPGETIVVRGTSPVAGACTLELVSERGRLTFAPPRRARYDESIEAAAEYLDTYRRANDRRYASATLPVPDGQFTAELTVPSAAAGNCYIRAFISGSGEHAVGAAKLHVERASGR